MAETRRMHTGTFHRKVLSTPVAPPRGSRIVIPFFSSPEQEYDFFASIFEEQASETARQALRIGRVSLLALRRSSTTLASRGKGSYDDLVVILRKMGTVRRANRFPICTEPGAQYSARAAPQGSGRVDARYAGVAFSKREGADVNNDGVGDAGRLRPGTYLYFEKTGGYLGDRAFQVKYKQAAERDTDGDGRFTPADPSRIDPTTAGTSMYIHRGGDDTVLEPNTWSAGCQTIPKNRYKSFLASLGTPGSFYYGLVDWC